MAEISKGCTLPGKNIVQDDKESPTQMEINDRLRDQVERDRDSFDKSDDVGQILLALQVLMPSMEPLGLAAQMSGRMEMSQAANKVNLRSSPPLRLMLRDGNEDGNSCTFMPQKPAFHDGAVSRNTVPTFRHEQYFQAAEFSGKAALVSNHVSTITQEHSAPQRKYEENIREKILHEDVVKSGNDVSEKLPRERQTASSLLPGSKKQGMAVVALPKVAVHTTDDTGWVYNFRSWGAQHAVRIAPQGGSSNSVLPHSVISLHPSSFLVEQRLCEHGGLFENDKSWRTKSHDDEPRQQHQRRHEKDEEDT